MHIYLYEPRDDRAKGLAAELRAAGIVSVRISDTFFQGDLGLLNREGHEICPLLLADSTATLDQIGKLRGAGCRNPIIVMRDFRNASAAARTLDHGADDDIVIPLKGIEVQSRINSITRRAHGHAAQSIRIGAVTAYFDGRDPEVAGETVFLSGREHAVFRQLALNASRVVSKAAIYDAVYGMADEQPFDKVIDVYICKIRKKIASAAGGGHRYIETVHGRGYKLSPPDIMQATCDQDLPLLREDEQSRDQTRRLHEVQE
jgi:two-component system cell cycle response regulator CtrA